MSQEYMNILKENYFLIVYGFTLLISLYKYRTYFDTILNFFPILITYTFLNELLGYLIKNHPGYSFFKDLNYSSINDVIYNIYGIVFFAFFYHIYWRIISKHEYKKKDFNSSRCCLFILPNKLLFSESN